MILAGDIGGTNTRIAFFDQEGQRLKLLHEKIYSSHEYKSLNEILSLVLFDYGRNIELACFGIAGPVLHGKVSTPNLPWVIDAGEIARQLGIKNVWLINDLHAHASGIDDLGPDDFVSINSIETSEGNAALIAAGTGLGEAGLYWDGVRRHAFPCEGGHCDFAPRDDLEVRLLQYLSKKFGRVSYERVLSGPGFRNIYEFLRDTGTEEEPAWLKQELSQLADPVPTISQYGLQGKTAICIQTLEIFVRIYGAEAGNLALKMMATGGVFLSGGIAFKILPKLKEPAFLQAFVAKGRLQTLLETIPVRVIANDMVGLLGAARYALNNVTHEKAVGTK
jgi:glucokinase